MLLESVWEKLHESLFTEEVLDSTECSVQRKCYRNKNSDAQGNKFTLIQYFMESKICWLLHCTSLYKQSDELWIFRTFRTDHKYKFVAQ